MTEKTLTTENIKPALDALRGELAPWPVVAMKQDKLNTAQKSAVNSGITSSLVAQITANTAAIRALESAITGTGLRALVVSSLPAVGTLGILYIVPVTTYDPETDADVVNYSNEYIWIVAPDAPVTEGYYEQVGQTGIVINNGQLTITVNGTSVGTFTANQSGDTTAAITVPTNADYVDRTTNQTIAGTKTFTSTIDGTAAKAIADEDGTSIKTGYVNVAGNQTVTGQKTWSGNQFFTSPMYPKNTSYEIGNTPASNVVIPIYFTDKNNVHTGYVRSVVLATGKTQSELLARNKFTNGALSPTGTDITSTLQVEVQSNGDKTLYFDGSIRNNVLPYATNTYSLGSSSYQWSSVYAQTYYYNGTAWGLDKANTWTGDNTFSSTLKQVNSTVTKGTIPQSDTTAFSVYWGGTGVSSLNNALFAQRGYVNADGSTTYVLYAYENATGGTQTQLSLKYDPNDTVNKRYAFLRGDFRPYSNGDNNLGTSTNKWKTLNGINPGALSLPGISNFVELDKTNWYLDGTATDIIASGDGWIQVVVTGDSTSYVVLQVGYYGYPNCYYRATGTAIVDSASAMLPVKSGQGVRMFLKGTSIYIARFLPCLGNV